MSINKYIEDVVINDPIKTREELKAIIKKYVRECRLEAREAREAKQAAQRKRQKETM